MPSINLTRREKLLQKNKIFSIQALLYLPRIFISGSGTRSPRSINPLVDIGRIHEFSKILGLYPVLLPRVLRHLCPQNRLYYANVFNIRVSYQTVLHYAESVAYHCFRFSLQFKRPRGCDTSAGDETYIKIIGGEWAYVFLFISSKSLVLSAYHLAHSTALFLPLSQ